MSDFESSGGVVRNEVCPLDNVSDITALAHLHSPPAYKMPLCLRLERRGSAVQLISEFSESTDLLRKNHDYPCVPE